MANGKEIELAWAAGFFDGEGGFYVNKGRGKNFHLQNSIKQVDIRPLVRFKDAVGYGNITGPYQSNPNDDKYVRKLQFRWSVSGKNAYRFADLIKDYLSEPKREQLEKALKTIKENNI